MLKNFGGKPRINPLNFFDTKIAEKMKLNTLNTIELQGKKFLDYWQRFDIPRMVANQQFREVRALINEDKRLFDNAARIQPPPANSKLQPFFGKIDITDYLAQSMLTHTFRDGNQIKQVQLSPTEAMIKILVDGTPTVATGSANSLEKSNANSIEVLKRLDEPEILTQYLAMDINQWFTDQSGLISTGDMVNLIEKNIAVESILVAAAQLRNEAARQNPAIKPTFGLTHSAGNLARMIALHLQRERFIDPSDVNTGFLAALGAPFGDGLFLEGFNGLFKGQVGQSLNIRPAFDILEESLLVGLEMRGIDHLYRQIPFVTLKSGSHQLIPNISALKEKLDTENISMAEMIDRLSGTPLLVAKELFFDGERELVYVQDSTQPSFNEGRRILSSEDRTSGGNRGGENDNISRRNKALTTDTRLTNTTPRKSLSLLEDDRDKLQRRAEQNDGNSDSKLRDPLNRRKQDRLRNKHK